MSDFSLVDTSIHITSTTYNTFHPFVNTLALANDVETNPGPVSSELQQVIDSINDNINVKFDTIQLQFAELSSSVKCIKDDITTVNLKMASLSSNVSDIDRDMKDVQNRVAAIEEETEKQEQYSRRENILLYGVGELPGESFDNVRSRITSILNSNVSAKKWQDADIVRAHRIGKQNTDTTSRSPLHNKPRPIIVRFHQFHDKLTVLKARTSLKSVGIGVSGDLTQKQRQQLSSLPETKRGFFKGGKLHVIDRPPPHNVSHRPSDAPVQPFINNSQSALQPTSLPSSQSQLFQYSSNLSASHVAQR